MLNNKKLLDSCESSREARNSSGGSRKKAPILSVVLPPERKRVVGILKAEDLLAAHNQRVLKDRFLQLPPKGEQKSRGESWPDGR
jgi:hypothetical protein